MLEDKSPQEVWTGKKPSLSHLRVFGCDAYVNVPKEKRTKLDSKYEKCIFIGYKDHLKGYKLWNPISRKVVYNRDVVFREVKDVIKHDLKLINASIVANHRLPKIRECHPMCVLGHNTRKSDRYS